MNNYIVAGIDLGDSSSLATVLSPSGEVAAEVQFPDDGGRVRIVLG